MEINVNIIKFYTGKYWWFYFKKFKNINGFIIRIMGMHFIIKEKNGTEKLIKKFISYNN
jgi:hypothetical protein